MNLGLRDRDSPLGGLSSLSTMLQLQQQPTAETLGVHHRHRPANFRAARIAAMMPMTRCGPHPSEYLNLSLLIRQQLCARL